MGLEAMALLVIMIHGRGQGAKERQWERLTYNDQPTAGLT